MPRLSRAGCGPACAEAGWHPPGYPWRAAGSHSTNRGNRMTAPEMNRYCNVMEDVKGRIIAIDLIGTPAGQAVPVVVRIESIYLQYRKILELFAFASLLTAPEKYAQVYEGYCKQRDAAQLLQVLEQANPD